MNKKNNFENIKKYLPAVILFPVLIVILTYPLTFKINASVPGFFSTDEVFAPVGDAWRIKHSFLNGLPIGQTNLIAYPFGINLDAKGIGSLWFFIFSRIAMLTNHVLTYNAQMMANIFLIAVFMYLLVYFLTKHKLCGLLSGVIFAFCPYIFIRAWQHLGETYHWQMILFLGMLFRLRNENKLRIKVVFILSFVLTIINFNSIYYTAVILGVYLIYLTRRWSRNQEYFKKIFVLMSIAFTILFPQILSIFKNVVINKKTEASAFNIYHRPFDDLFSQSARPLSYFIPAPVHPLLGGMAKGLIGSSFYGDSFTEHTLYLGWTPILLAFFVFKKWRRERRRRDARFLDEKYIAGPDAAAGNIRKEKGKVYKRINAEDNYYIGFFLLLAVAAWLFSQPPWWRIGPIKIFMPSFFMYKILPPFRAYCRFGIVVMLAVAVLAGYGLKYILERFKTNGKKVLITSLFCGLVLFEFWNYPPFKVIDVSKSPQAYYWLSEQEGKFAIAEYPLDIDLPNEMYKFYQIFHHKPIINGTIPGTEPNMVARTITDLSNPLTASKLKGLGVKYVFVHHDHYLNTELFEKKKELEEIPSNPSLKFVKSFSPQSCPAATQCVYKSGQIDVYEVTANPMSLDNILKNAVLLSRMGKRKK